MWDKNVESREACEVGPVSEVVLEDRNEMLFESWSLGTASGPTDCSKW